jgi:hypothetical protein
MIDFKFLPNAARARLLDRRMHEELAQSLRHVSQACRDACSDISAALEPVIALIDSGATVPPGTFGRYYELTSALMRDEVANALAISCELFEATIFPLEPVVALGDPQLADSALYHRMMNSDETQDISFEPPAPAVADAFRERLTAGFALLDRTIPELAEEVRAIVRQIVIAGGDPTRKLQFDGASHYQLWGALFLNGSFHPDAIAVAEVLAHETAHSLLFGFCTEEALVENDDDELFPSPLRTDLRPMDGIYHATFVSARMHWAMSTLSRSDALSEPERKRAAEAAAADMENFHSGLGIVQTRGRLTATGERLMASAKEYMDSARALAG